MWVSEGVSERDAGAGVGLHPRGGIADSDLQTDGETPALPVIIMQLRQNVDYGYLQGPPGRAPR